MAETIRKLRAHGVLWTRRETREVEFEARYHRFQVTVSPDSHGGWMWIIYVPDSHAVMSGFRQTRAAALRAAMIDARDLLKKRRAGTLPPPEWLRARKEE
jgi:hypothetical protein